MRLGRLRDRPESPACPLPLSGERSPLPFGRSLRRPQFSVGEVGALEHQVMGEMPGASVGEAIPEIKPGRAMEGPAGRPGWAFERGPAEKLPAGNFLDFSFLQVCAGRGGVPISPAGHSAGKAESRKLPAGNLADRLLGMGVV